MRQSAPPGEVTGLDWQPTFQDGALGDVTGRDMNCDRRFFEEALFVGEPPKPDSGAVPRRSIGEETDRATPGTLTVPADEGLGGVPQPNGGSLLF